MVAHLPPLLEVMFTEADPEVNWKFWLLPACLMVYSTESKVTCMHSFPLMSCTFLSKELEILGT